VKLPLSWLTSMVDVDLPIDELVEVMSLNGLEVEDVTAPGAGTRDVRTARVLAWQPHPDADKLRVVQVTGDGGEGRIELVCGAANFDVGDVVAHARPGGAVPGVAGPDGSKGLELATREIRGVVSNGMLASAKELELGEDHAGILVLPPDTPLGVDLVELLPIGEPVVEVAVQPDRGDHLSVIGVARDVAAILDTSWHAPEVPDLPDGPTLPVTLDTDGCASFHTVVVEGVTVQPSPPWLRQRLAQCGVRSIDVVVDVTNLVMLELGQPLHAFDLERLHGPSLRVRAAADGETLTTLDDQRRTLVAGDLVIDDADHAVSLAGVMGGLDTEVTAGTTRVLLEAAVWEPAVIRATSRRLGLVSEASQRFERGVDPAGAGRAVARAAALLADLAGGRVTGSDAVVAPSAPDWVRRDEVVVDPARMRSLLALEFDAATQATLLERAGCTVVNDRDRLVVTPPSWRGDLQRPADVAEELARLHGYDRIPATLPSLTVTGGLTPAQRREREARSIALGAGFHEAVTRPFVGADALVGVVPSAGRVQLANPLAKDASAMRPSLLEGLLQALRRNHGQGRPGTALVELGRLFRPVDDPLASAIDGSIDDSIDGDWRWRAPDGQQLPVQPRTLALAAQGLRLGRGWLDTDDHWSVYDLLAVVDEVALRLAPPDDETWRLERVPVERDGLHPGRTVALHLRGHEVGVVGQLHPDEADRRDLPEPVVVAELLLEPFLLAIPPADHPPVPARNLVRHPALTVDVALVADDDVPYTSLERVVRAGAGELLDELWWFDEYRGAQVGEGARSVAIRLRLQSPDRQLTDEDAERVIAAVAAEAETIGATLRR
jgi:phenylalanyl-tRNA synthetase beta chain